MAKEELLEFEGEVTEELPDGNFRVKLDNEHVILAYTAGKMRKFRIRTGVGDRVTVEMSPYDLARGRITFRHKSAQPTTAATGQRRAMWRKRRSTTARARLPPSLHGARLHLGAVGHLVRQVDRDPVALPKPLGHRHRVSVGRRD